MPRTKFNTARTMYNTPHTVYNMLLFNLSMTCTKLVLGGDELWYRYIYFKWFPKYFPYTFLHHKDVSNACESINSWMGVFESDFPESF